MDKAGHGTAMFKDKGHVSPAHLQHGARRGAQPEARIEKSGIVGAELPISGAIGAISAASVSGISTGSREARM